MILILGTGTLARAIATRISNATMIGRPDFDFCVQADCDALIKKYPNPDFLINTVGVLSQDIWRNLVTNFVSPCYIASKYLSSSDCHVINISSASAWWPSYPNLNFERFSYNLAKESLSNFGIYANRIIIEKSNKLTTIEPGRFLSNMNNDAGIDIEKIVDCIQMAMTHKLQQVSLIKS